MYMVQGKRGDKRGTNGYVSSSIFRPSSDESDDGEPDTHEIENAYMRLNSYQPISKSQ